VKPAPKSSNATRQPNLFSESTKRDDSSMSSSATVSVISRIRRDARSWRSCRRSSSWRSHGGPSPLFLAQYIAQGTANAGGDVVVLSQAAARYPSLGFEQDILLPGGATALAADGPRVDILV
jgi:hypothetical protein